MLISIAEQMCLPFPLIATIESATSLVMHLLYLMFSWTAAFTPSLQTFHAHDVFINQRATCGFGDRWLTAATPQ